ncbi:MAG: hypothetical protein RLZZ22_1897 [Pseudomonadota bacterium]|jgi:hypothetical protein
MKAAQWAKKIRQILLQWWEGINVCETTGAHQVGRMSLGAWSAITLHHSEWPDSVWH